MHICFIHKGREHLGIEHLSAMLKMHGHKTTLLVDPGLFSKTDNVFHNKYLEKLFIEWYTFDTKIFQGTYDLIAYSPYSTTYRWACHLAQVIKKRSSLPVVFGGIHTTLKAETVIQNSFIDYAIAGEGEYALLELIEYLEGKREINSVRNLYYKKGGAVHTPNTISSINNLDTLPYADKNIFKQTLLFKEDYMLMTTRGCLFNCSFCCEGAIKKTIKKSTFRRRSVDSVIDELKRAQRLYHSKKIIFFDSIFFNDKKWLQDFVNRYRQSIRVPYKCIGHVQFFDEEIAYLLKNSGCYCVEFGIESLHEKKKKEILHRFETNEQINRCLTLCDKIQLAYDVNILFGLPEHTEDDYIFTAQFLKGRKYLNRIKCFYLVFYPKTDIVDIAYTKGILTKTAECVNENETPNSIN